MNVRSLVLVAVACSFAPRAAVAQDDGPKAGAPLSGWIHLDVGFGTPSAKCSDCSLSYGGPGFSGGIGAGLTSGKASIGLEQNGTAVLFADSRNTARFRMLTLGLATSPRFSWRAGVGTGRYRLDPTVLVDERLAGMVGLEYRPRETPDGGILLEFLQTAQGDDVSQSGAPERYSMRTIRVVAVWRILLGR